MRIWSLHPKYLDAKGLVAAWREALLAKNVLGNKTKGYKNHPQLERFKAAKNPIDAINEYLSELYKEAESRSYNFDKTKINWQFKPTIINITSGQLKYEFCHLLKKLKIRDYAKYLEYKDEKEITPLKMFEIVDGEIEKWEVITR